MSPNTFRVKNWELIFDKAIEAIDKISKERGQPTLNRKELDETISDRLETVAVHSSLCMKVSSKLPRQGLAFQLNNYRDSENEFDSEYVPKLSFRVGLLYVSVLTVISHSVMITLAVTAPTAPAITATTVNQALHQFRSDRFHSAEIQNRG